MRWPLVGGIREVRGPTAWIGILVLSGGIGGSRKLSCFLFELSVCGCLCGLILYLYYCPYCIRVSRVYAWIKCRARKEERNNIFQYLDTWHWCQIFGLTFEYLIFKNNQTSPWMFHSRRRWKSIMGRLLADKTNKLYNKKKL
jgi:hypothetical protein